MKKSKKIISLLLSLIMTLSVFNIVPFTAGAAEADFADTGASGTTGDCTWTLDDNGVLTISGNGKMGDYDSTYRNGYVTTAAWGGYSFNTVVIESGVTSIGENAFSGCTGLTSVTIGNSVTSIGEEAFENCKGLTSVDIPDSVTSIGWYAFDGCSSLTSVTIGNSVTSIGSDAFRNCTRLTSVTIPDSVTSIGLGAFYECTGLTSVTIPDSVTRIGGSAFYNTAWYNNQPNGLVYAGKVAYKMKGTCPSEVVIKDGTLVIADFAFYDCTSLKSVTIPDSVTSIGEYAFEDCTGLTSITIPDSVTSIGYYAFYNTAWYNNQPDGLVYAGKVAYKMKGTCPSEVVIKDGTLGIAVIAFYGCSSLTSVTIPDSVTSIGSGAFSECTGLTSVTIPDSVTSIGYRAFYGCSSLTSVTIPDSVTSIGDYAFRDCTGLTSVTIPDSVTSIGEKALGYYYDNGYYKKISGFKIYGYKDTEAEKYAKENGFSFVPVIAICDNCQAPIPVSNIDVKYDATCTEDGTAYWHCGDCGELGESVLPALGHDYKTVVTPLTCTEGGYTTHTCSHCGDTYITDELKAPGHSYSAVVTPPTCTEDGFTTHTCSRCNDTYVTDEVAALGHDYALNVKKDPTATQQGIMTAECTRCSKKKNVVLPVLSDKDYKLTRCDEQGKATYTLKDKTYGVYKTVADAPEGWLSSDNILGDIDNDKAVDVRDATWIQRLVAGIEIPFTVADVYADIDCDGEVTIMDATAIQYYLIKSKNPYKIGQSIA